MGKRKDDRPICNCGAYAFPHRVGGKCDGSSFAEFYYYNISSLCDTCNCKGTDGCDVESGREDIHRAECYIEAKHCAPGEHLQLKMEEPEEPYY